MIQRISFTDFTDAFRDYNRKENFSYNGLRALYNYLEDLEEDTGQNIELDVIALCCEFSEYKDIEEFINNHNDFDDFNEFLNDEYPELLREYEKYKKEKTFMERGLNLSYPLKEFIIYKMGKKFVYLDYIERLEEEIRNKTTLIKLGDDLDDGFIIQSY